MGLGVTSACAVLSRMPRGRVPQAGLGVGLVIRRPLLAPRVRWLALAATRFFVSAADDVNLRVCGQFAGEWRLGVACRLAFDGPRAARRSRAARRRTATVAAL